MDKQELVELKARISRIDLSLIKLTNKHNNLSHRVDGIDDELNELWDSITLHKKGAKENE